MTPDLLKAVAGRLNVPLAEPLAQACARWWPVHGLVTVDRQAIFLAQACHETNGFQTLIEYGSGDGPDADPWDDYLTKSYDTRTDLGNTPEIDGDGEKYRGRGVFQITGRNNYQRLGQIMGRDLVDQPEQLAEPDAAVESACLFWAGHGFNDLADSRDMLTITRRLNGGLNGWDDRFRYWGRAWKALAG